MKALKNFDRLNIAYHTQLCTIFVLVFVQWFKFVVTCLLPKEKDNNKLGLSWAKLSSSWDWALLQL